MRESHGDFITALLLESSAFTRLADMGEGDQGALLGLIISIWDGIRLMAEKWSPLPCSGIAKYKMTHPNARKALTPFRLRLSFTLR